MRLARASLLVGVVVSASLLLSGCFKENKGPCPFVRIPTLLGQVTQFGDGQQRDATNVVFQSRITDVAMACEYSEAKYATQAVQPTGRDTMEVQLRIKFSTQRGPLAQGATVDAKYLVAVTDLRDNILSRGEFPVKLKLGQSGQAVVTDEEAWMLFKVQDKSGSAYRIYTGFFLTQDQLEFNRSLAGG